MLLRVPTHAEQGGQAGVAGLDFIRNPWVIAGTIAAAIAIPIAVANSGDDPLEAAFTAEPTSGPAPLSVQFTDQSTGSSITWRWDFDGDGAADSTEQNPSYTYEQAGTYTVALTVSDAVLPVSSTETKEAYVTAQAAAGAEAADLAVDFTASPREGTAPLTVAFTDRTEGLTAPGQTAWLWDCDGDGVVDSHQRHTSHTYMEPGTYTVTLWVQCPSTGGSQTKAAYVSVGSPVQADFSASPTEGRAPLTVVFTDESTGLSDRETSWRWDWDGDGTADSHQQHPSHTYVEPGTYSVTLWVQDLYGAGTKAKTDYIIVAPPRVQARFSADHQEGVAPLTVAFTDQSTGDIGRWEWDFDGDGTADSTRQNPSCVYREPGVYTVSLRVENGTSDIETRADYVTVLAPAQADFTAYPRQGTAPLVVSFTDQSGGSINRWEWDFNGDGVVDSTEQNPSHIYANPGTYAVSLTVGNGTSDTETKFHYITVSSPSPGEGPGEEQQ